MKLKSLISTAIFCVSLLSLTLGSGCTGTPNRKAFVAVGVTTESVKHTIDAFNDWRALHPLTREQAQTYANALKAYVDACEIVRSAENAADGSGSDRLTIAQNAADAAAGSLLAFIADIAPLIIKQPTN